MSTKKQAVFGMVVVAALMLSAPVLSMAGDLNPPAAPGPTMKTLDEVYSTKSWSKKFTCDSSTNCPRFEVLTDFNNEAVLDKETGLVWEKSPSTTTANWPTATYTCRDKAVGNRKGWRLPTVEQLESLLDPTRFNPSLPAGHPFTNVQSSIYWSASTMPGSTAYAWNVSFYSGSVGDFGTTNFYYMWCVRGGQGYDGQ